MESTNETPISSQSNNEQHVEINQSEQLGLLVNKELQNIADKVKVPNFNVELNELLFSTGSVIAGGFVLGAIRGQLSTKSDIDIYSPYESFKPIFDYLMKNGRYININIASPYDSSFFQKNGILTRFNFILPADYYFKGYGKKEAGHLEWPGGVINHHKGKSVSVDLMVLVENRTILETVSNFDFTFCEVWYDGKTVNGTYLDDTLAGKGFLRKDYLPAFYAGNVFTLKRYAKYLSRCYQIGLDKLDEGYQYTIPDIDAEHFLALKVLQDYAKELDCGFNGYRNSRPNFVHSVIVVLSTDINVIVKKALIQADKYDDYQLKELIHTTTTTWLNVSYHSIERGETSRDWAKVAQICEDVLKRLK